MSRKGRRSGSAPASAPGPRASASEAAFLTGSARPVLWMLARFVLAYSLLWALLWALRPVVYPALGSAALDLVALSTEVPRIRDLVWEGAAFQIHSPLYSGHMVLTAPWFEVLLLIPLAFALALPLGPHSIAARARSCGWLALASFALGVLVLSNNASAALSQTLGHQGLAIFSGGRAAFHQTGREWTWNLCTIVLPATACLWLAAPLLPGSSLRQPRRRPRFVPGPGLRLALAAILALGLAAFAGSRAEDAISRIDLESLLRDLEPLNPQIGAYFLKLGESALRAGQLDAARENFVVAVRYPDYAKAARQGLERVRRAAAGGQP